MEQHLTTGISSREGYWRSQMASCASSGLTIAAYCRQQGVSLAQYHWWKGELKRRDQRSVSASVPFAEVRGCVEVLGAGAPLEVVLCHNRRILVRPGFDSGALSSVVRVLEDAGC